MGIRQDLYDPRLHGAKLVGGFKLTFNAVVAATGSNQAGARAVNPGFTRVSDANGTRGVRLQAHDPVDGDSYFIKNLTTTTGATLAVYPPTGHIIDALATNGAFTVGLGGAVLFVNTGANRWTSFAF